MTRRTRRWFLSSAAATGATLLTGGALNANTGSQLPTWGETQGATDLQAGPLGLNPALDPGQIPVAIRVPEANVDAEVERQQIVDGQMLDPSGPWVVAWYEQTARVGEIGNFVASGHVDYWGIGKSVFAEIASVPEGSPIDVTGRDGTIYTYAVTNITRIDVTTITADELNSPEIVGDTDYAALTLITCGGDFNGQEYTERDIIRGELTSVQAPDGAGTDVSTDDAASGDAPAESGALAIGSAASLNSDGINMRSEPTTSSDVVSVLGNGTAVTVIDGPLDADGYTWWLVELENGSTGWVAADFLSPQ